MICRRCQEFCVMVYELTCMIIFLSQYSYRKHFLVHNTWALGTMVLKRLHPQITDILASKHGIHEELQPVFYRLLRKGETFYSKEYRRTKKRNSYTIAFHSGDVISYGYIMYFVNINSIKLPFAVVQRLVPVRVDKFHPVTSVQLQQVEIVHVNNIIEKCVCMHLRNSTYLATFPSHLNVD